MSEEIGHPPAPRLPLTLEVSYKPSYARDEKLGTLKNISKTGAFLALIAPEEKAERKVTLTLNVCGNQRKIAAKVIWNSGAGYGIHFLPRNQRDHLIILDLLECVQNLRVEKKDAMSNLFKHIV